MVLTDEGVIFFRQLTAGRAGSEIMLCKTNGQAWRASHQLRPTAQACQHAKIDPPISFHALRHALASHAVMNGVPLLVVAKNLGHADTRMVEKHYGHLAPSYIADAIRAGAPKFGFKPDPTVTPLREIGRWRSVAVPPGSTRLNLAVHHANWLMEAWLADVPVIGIRVMLSSLAGSPEVSGSDWGMLEQAREQPAHDGAEGNQGGALSAGYYPCDGTTPRYHRATAHQGSQDGAPDQDAGH